MIYSRPSLWTGGLAGRNTGSITASYARGRVTGPGFGPTGGLVGHKDSSGTATDSYWDTETSGQSGSAVGTGKTTTELHSPTSYSGIYLNWNLDLDADGTGDNPWQFLSSAQYPALA